MRLLSPYRRHATTRISRCRDAHWGLLPDSLMMPLISAVVVFLLVALAEWLHVRRIRVAARLAFGPAGTARTWTRAVPWLRVASLTAFAWGVTTLLIIKLEAPDDASAKQRHDAEATRLVF